MLGIDYDPDIRLKLWPRAIDEAYVQSLLDSEWLSGDHIFVGLNVSASRQWPTKNWPLEHMAKLCDILGHKNIRVILTGEDKDKILARKLIARAHAKPASFVGKTTILQLAALIKRCRVYISAGFSAFACGGRHAGARDSSFWANGRPASYAAGG